MAGTTRTRTGATTAERPRGVVRAFGRSAQPAVTLDVRTAYDFVVSLADPTAPSDEILPVHRDWLARSRDAVAGDASLADVDRDTWELAWTAAMHAIDRPEIRTAADLVALVEGLSPVVAARALFTDELADPAVRPLVERALAGDETAADSLETRIADQDETAGAWCGGARMAATRHPERFKSQLVRLLKAWLPLFATVEQDVERMIRRDAALRADDIARLAPLDLVERVTEGIRSIPEPGVRRIILAPTYFGRPYNHLLAGDDFRFYAYPISDAAIEDLDPTAPPVSLERFHRALGDGSRLRIVRLLAQRDWYLTELANELGLSKPTVKHHLAQLRAAGLATVTEEGALMYWSLRRERLDEAHDELRRFLG
jgi:DNA-binding transcriptional ArsR family regulator